MTIKKSQEIISLYGKALAQASSGNLFLPKETLPCSVPRIKFAFYRYIVDLIRTGEISKEKVESIIVAYSHLCFFIDEKQAEMMNRITRNKDNLTREVLELAGENKEYLRLTNIYKDLLRHEIQEFINETLQNQHI